MLRVAKLCRGRLGPRRRLATGARFRGKAWPRAAEPVTEPCPGRRGPLALPRAASSIQCAALPRAAGPAANPCHGLPAPSRASPWSSPPVSSKTLPRPTPWQGFATGCRPRSNPIPRARGEGPCLATTRAGGRSSPWGARPASPRAAGPAARLCFDGWARPCRASLSRWRSFESGGRTVARLATCAGARGKAFPRKPMAKDSRGKSGPWQRKALPQAAGLAVRLYRDARAHGEALPRTTGPAARSCHGRPARGRGRPSLWRRFARPAAGLCHGRHGPRQRFAAGGRARGKAVPRAAGHGARLPRAPCHGRPGPWRGLATGGQTRGMPATNLCQGPRARAAGSRASPRAAGPATRLGPVAKPCHGPVAIARQARRKVFSLASQARLCHGARWPWLVFATDNRTRGKAAPRSWRSAVGAGASPCHGRPAPRQGLSTAARGKA